MNITLADPRVPVNPGKLRCPPIEGWAFVYLAAGLPKLSMNPHLPKPDAPVTWRDRIRALRNIPPLLADGLENQSLPGLRRTPVSPDYRLSGGGSTVGRQADHRRRGRPDRSPARRSPPSLVVPWHRDRHCRVQRFAGARAINLCDSLVGDQFTNHISLQTDGARNASSIWCRSRIRCSTTNWSAPAAKPRAVSA